MTPERRAELRALLAKEALGQWRMAVPNADESVWIIAGGLGLKIARVHQGAIANAPINADLIVAARNDLPALLDALDAADARERRLREAVAAMVAWHDQAVDMESADRSLSFLTRLDALRAALSEVAPDA